MPPTLLMPASEKLKHADHKIPEGISAIEYITNWLRDRMIAPQSKYKGLEDRILVVKSMTGSGKSTLMPVEIFHLLKPAESKQAYRGPGVLCTQPRVLTAKDIAENQIGNAPWFPDMIINETVGYQTGSFTQRPSYNNLLYSTVGVLRAQLDFRDDEFIMGKYKFIIIDEAHERSLDTDCTLMKLKYFYLRNKDNHRLPFLILTSATMDTNKYAKYFEVGKDNIMEVEGLSFPKTTHWAESDTQDTWKGVFDKILEIHRKFPDDPIGKGDMMIFVSSTKPWQKMNIKEKLEEQAKDLLIAFIDRDEVNSQSDFYHYITGSKPLPEGIKRMAIFATNAAETGLTVESLKYVIDIGFNNTNEIYFPYGINGIINRPTAQSNIEQRKGRCGRKFPGEFYPLYTEKTFNQLLEQQYPEIVSTGADGIILDIIKAQQDYKLYQKKRPEFLIEDIDTLDLPPMDSLMLSLEKCITFGYAAYNADLGYRKMIGYGITDLGRLVIKISRDLTLESARVLLSGYMYGVSIQDVILLTVILHRDFSKMRRTLLKTNVIQHCLPGSLDNTTVDTFRKLVSCEFIELLCIVSTIFYKLEGESINDFDKWLETIGLTGPDVTKVVWKYNAITKAMLSVGMDITQNADRRLILTDDPDTFMQTVIQLKQCLYSGYLLNTLRWVPGKEGPDGKIRNGSYQTRHGISMRVKLPPYMISDDNQPQVLITDSLSMNSKMFGEEIMYELKVGNISIIDGYCGDILDTLMYIQCQQPRQKWTQNNKKDQRQDKKKKHSKK
jgi:hypothetical protein